MHAPQYVSHQASRPLMPPRPPLQPAVTTQSIKDMLAMDRIAVIEWLADWGAQHFRDSLYTTFIMPLVNSQELPNGGYAPGGHPLWVPVGLAGGCHHIPVADIYSAVGIYLTLAIPARNREQAILLILVYANWCTKLQMTSPFRPAMVNMCWLEDPHRPGDIQLILTVKDGQRAYTVAGSSLPPRRMDELTEKEWIFKWSKTAPMYHKYDASAARKLAMNAALGRQAVDGFLAQAREQASLKDIAVLAGRDFGDCAESLPFTMLAIAFENPAIQGRLYTLAVRPSDAGKPFEKRRATIRGLTTQEILALLPKKGGGQRACEFCSAMAAHIYEFRGRKLNWCDLGSYEWSAWLSV